MIDSTEITITPFPCDWREVSDQSWTFQTRIPNLRIHKNEKYSKISIYFLVNEIIAWFLFSKKCNWVLRFFSEKNKIINRNKIFSRFLKSLENIYRNSIFRFFLKRNHKSIYGNSLFHVFYKHKNINRNQWF